MCLHKQIYLFKEWVNYIMTFKLASLSLPSKGMNMFMARSDNEPLTKRRLFLIIFIFFIVLTSFRIGWMMYYKTPNHPQAINGVIDLSDWDMVS